jgi:hypothetical protein
MPHGLIDAYRLVIFPVVLGRGQRLFADGAPTATMRLVDSHRTGSGVVINTYEAAGAWPSGQSSPRMLLASLNPRRREARLDANGASGRAKGHRGGVGRAP